MIESPRAPQSGYRVWRMKAVRLAIHLSVAGVVATLCACGSPSRAVAFRVIDAATDAPLAYARLRAAPLSTNGIPLPVSLEHLREASEHVRVSASTDKQGLATLRLFKSLPSVIEVFRWAPASSTQSTTATWIYDPYDRSLTRAWPRRREAQVVQNVRLEVAGR